MEPGERDSPRSWDCRLPFPVKLSRSPWGAHEGPPTLLPTSESRKRRQSQFKPAQQELERLSSSARRLPPTQGSQTRPRSWRRAPGCWRNSPLCPWRCRGPAARGKPACGWAPEGWADCGQPHPCARPPPVWRSPWC